MSTETNTITLQDIQTMLQIIDLSASKGAFQGQELLVVGTLRENLVKVMVDSTEPEPEPEENAEINAITDTAWTQEVKDASADSQSKNAELIA